MNDSASVASSSLAIAEKTPRRNGGCVGIFFQLFDWNRRFTKKKLTSKRLLPPDRAKEASKQPKVRLIADENSGGFPNKNKNGVNGDQTPNLVARLMGLESMPPVHDKREKVVCKETKSHEIRPQKVQKTGMVDRRSVTRFGAEALQLKHVLSHSRKSTSHHAKLTTPVKSTGHHPKRNASRLIGAATRILEPGLQGRNKARYSIGYGQGARRLVNGFGTERVKGEDVGTLTGQGSCRNCGNLIDSVEAASKRDVHTSVFDSVNPSKASPNCNNSRYDHERESLLPADYFKECNRDQLKLNRFPYSIDTKDVVAPIKGLSGGARSRGVGKGDDMKFDKKGKFESVRVSCSSPRQKRQVPCTRRQGESCVVSSSVNRVVWKPDFQGQIGNKNSIDGMPFRFNSPTKNRCEVSTKVKVERGGNNLNVSPCKMASRKRLTSNPSDEKICLQKPFPSKVAAYESRIYRNHLPHHQSYRLDHRHGFSLQPAKSERVEGLIRAQNGDHPGVLEASFSNDSCCSSSLEDSSVRTHHADSMSYSYDDESQFQESETEPFFSRVALRKENAHYKLVADLLTYISQVLCSMGFVDVRRNRNIKEVIFNSELVLRNQMTHNPNEMNSFFICDLILELDTLADVMWTRLGNFLGSQKSGYQLKRFVFDSLIEYLELKYCQYTKCGFRTWTSLPRFLGFGKLVRDVVEEVRRWMCVTSDELKVEMDARHCVGKWSDFEIEAYETGAKVAWDIFETLIDEVVIDISTVVGGFRV
ncbi:hypothetical protein QVD17_18782 [Tagetes erecta]|uniref:DUF4378 domain-containing protein n=1 Tax=Tagetes erecta TaxID=13708 RepID=A0AAD8KID8_TARER|nr:hypothetical protein QVD17_18782 [Tagetes erecta]